MKIYTRTGDDGSTALYGGDRVAKDSLRIEACGTLDELNAALGLAAVICPEGELADTVIGLQRRLFEIGADLATPGNARDPSRLNDAATSDIESRIDRFWSTLPEMKHFILPGGTELAARLHVARAIARRAERCCVTLSRDEPVDRRLLVWLNRLSDLLFAMARRANQLEGLEDVPWISDGS
ncbi:MAG: ATP:cob(I)alamin adenosyltransferase [Phycisphaeraceae bacterium]|nr:ATP:cob(I)alamin adenosyltransferase [Phycisphaeraceae bacterium]